MFWYAALSYYLIPIDLSSFQLFHCCEAYITHIGGFGCILVVPVSSGSWEGAAGLGCFRGCGPGGVAKNFSEAPAGASMSGFFQVVGNSYLPKKLTRMDRKRYYFVAYQAERLYGGILARNQAIDMSPMRFLKRLQEAEERVAERREEEGLGRRQYYSNFVLLNALEISAEEFAEWEGEF